jgi:hypothetical protein
MGEFKVTINCYTDGWRTHKQRELLKMLTDDKDVRRQINRYIADAITPFVPRDSGKLARGRLITHKSITWGRGLAYAHYQFVGIVYAPNIPIMNKGTIIGWRSIPGMKKHPTDRKLGTPGEWRGWKFGYTTPGTQSHWTDAFRGQVRRNTQNKITAYLKRECRNRGLSNG